MLATQSLKKKLSFSKEEILIILAISIVASGARFWNLDDLSLGGDEAVYAGQARILAGDQSMERFFTLVSRGSSNFLVQQAMEAFVYIVAGFSDYTTRLPSAIFSVLTTVLVFLLGRELYGKWVGLLAAFLLAINGYAIALGRVALLDSTMVFFFTLSMIFVVKWSKRREQAKWAYFFAASLGIAIMTKTVAFLIIPIAILTMITMSGKPRGISLRTLTISSLIFTASLSPALLQVVFNYDVFIEFYSEGMSRQINVPETYYVDKLIAYSGIFFIALTTLGIAVALIRRKREDLHCLIWLAVVAIFFQIYSIKGWNYILPLIPVASILAARALVHIISFLRSVPTFKTGYGLIKRPQQSPVLNIKRIIGILGISLLVIASYSQIAIAIDNIIYERPFAGLREAAYWLKDNAPNARVMTISHGSAQYVLSLYAGIDAYPFGDFQLHTILPGGGTVAGAPPPDPLIQNGTVTFFVYYTSPGLGIGDDPIHNPATPTEANFIQLIYKYQSRTRYVIYDEFVGFEGDRIRQPRVWIYEVGKLLPQPVVKSSYDLDNQALYISGSGFLIDSYANIYFGRSIIQQVITDDTGSFSTSVKIPSTILCDRQLVAFDEGGNRSPVPREICKYPKELAGS